jgi:tripartite ATP-independent transporter DctP family solute receptor
MRAFAGAVVVAAFAAASAPAGAQVADIKFGTTNPPGGMLSRSAEDWAKRVNARVGDKAKVQVFSSSQLGNEKEMLQKLKLGTLEFSQPSTIMSTVTPEFGLFEMPYLVKDRAHMACIAKEIIWPILAPKVEARGYKIVGVMENGFRHITNNVRPIVKPADLNGVKLRTPAGIWRIKMFQAYGANPSPMEFSELFVALQTGVMDGQENPYTNILSGKLNEVQKYLTETNHVYTPGFALASLILWKKWPEDVQKAMLEAATETQAWTYETAARDEEVVRQKLIDGGMQFNKSDRDAFVAASRPVYETFAKEVEGGQELIDRALSLAKGC